MGVSHVRSPYYLAVYRLFVVLLVGAFWLTNATASICQKYQLRSLGGAGPAEWSSDISGATAAYCTFLGKTGCYLSGANWPKGLMYPCAEYGTCTSGQVNLNTQDVQCTNTCIAGQKAVVGGTVNGPESGSICYMQCVYTLDSGEGCYQPPVGSTAIVKWGGADGSWWCKHTMGQYTTNGATCQESAAVEPDMTQGGVPDGKCPGVASVPGGGTTTMYVPCDRTVSSTTVTSTRSISVGTGTATVSDSIQRTTNCVNGTCTIVINQTTTVINGSGTLTPGATTTGTMTVSGSPSGSGTGTGTSGDCSDDSTKARCADLDSPGDETPAHSTATFTFLPHTWSVWGGSDSCPSDVVWAAGPWFSATFSYAQACSWLANYAKPLILLMSTFTAFMILARPEK